MRADILTRQDANVDDEANQNSLDLEGNPMSYIPVLEDDPIQRLKNHSVPHAGLHHSTSVVSLRAVDGEGNVKGAASALVVWDPEDEDEFRLVTARHVVVDARAGNARIQVEAIQQQGSGDVFSIATVPVDDGTWRLADDDDLAVAPLPAGMLGSDHLVSAMTFERLAIATPHPTPEVELVGRWGLTPQSNIVLSRRGLVATPQRPTVPIYVGGDEPLHQRPMYLVDAFVTRGMSGGAVFQQTSPPMVLGIISAHAKIPAPVEKWAALPETVQTAAGSVWDAITPMNAGLVYVVPVMHVVPFLMATRRVKTDRPI
jgi:hypothetical protein